MMNYNTSNVYFCINICVSNVNMFILPDPKIKAQVRKFLATSTNPHSDIHYSNPSSPTSGRPQSPAASIYNTNSGISNIGRPGGHRVSSSDPQCRPSRIPTIASKSQQSWSAPQSPHGVNKVRQSHIPTANGTNLQPQHHNLQQQQQPNRAKFEAYMMTGDLILNLSRTPQSSGLITPHPKKVDSLRDSPIRSNKRKNGALTAPHAKYDSSPSSPSLSSDDNISVGSAHSNKKTIKDNSNNINNSDNLNLHNNNLNNNINSNTTTTSDIVMNDKNSRLSGGCVNYSSSSSNVSSKASTTTSSPNSSTSNNTFSSHSINTTNNGKQQLLQQHKEQINNGDSTCAIYNDADADDDGDDDDDANNETNDIVHVADKAGNNSKDMVDCLKICEDNELLCNDNDADVDDEGSDDKIINSKSHSSSSSATVKSEINNSSPEISYSVPTSPISLTTPILETGVLLKKKELPNSVPASPESGTQELIRRSNSNNNHQSQHQSSQQNGSNNVGAGGVGSSSIIRKCDASGFRTSRSEDHLQQTQRDGIGAIVPIDIDEDVNSSLNTLLDTRHDSEDSQVI